MRYESAENTNLKAEQRAQILHYRDGLLSGEPIEIEEDMVLYLNRSQVAQSTRFLYSATDIFDFAREVLQRHPKLRTIETHIEVGKMGCAAPPRAGMPPGTQIVIFGPVDHCILAIEEIDKTGEGLTARTQQIDPLAQVAAENGMLHIELYVDGQVIRLMHETMIERFGEPCNGWFRVVHRDLGLRALIPIHLCIDTVHDPRIGA